MRLAVSRVVTGVAVASMVATVAVVASSMSGRTDAAASSSVRSAAAPGREGLTSFDRTVSVAAQRRCTAVKRSFRPRTAGAHRVARSARVVAPPRDANGVPGVPPLTDEGKQMFAWDKEQGIRPGDPHGHVLFNAHTWPDGSALGNRLLAHLHVGDKITVRGKYARQNLCYRVVKRIKVPGDQPMPRYYSRSGPPRLAIAVCSGRRLGPGYWTHRTVWFAKPVPRR